MSVMPADALTCGSDVGTGAAGAEVIPLRAGIAVAPRPAIAPRHPGTAPRRVVPGGTPHATPGVPLRLTRRGRVVAAVAAALLVTVISLLAVGVAQATNHGASSGTARHG